VNLGWHHCRRRIITETLLAQCNVGRSKPLKRVPRVVWTTWSVLSPQAVATSLA